MLNKESATCCVLREMRNMKCDMCKSDMYYVLKIFISRSVIAL